MADEKMTSAAIRPARDAAKELLPIALNELVKTAEKLERGEPRLFFPNGIELIFFKLEVSGFKLEFKVAGEKGVSGLLNSGEIGVGLTGDVAEAVIKE